jgi:hypothetical protein
VAELTGKSIAFYEPDGATSASGAVLDDLLGGSTDIPYKLGIRNDGSVALASTFRAQIVRYSGNDGGAQIRIALDISTLAPPWGLTGALSEADAGGTWGGVGLVGAVVTALSDIGETIQSFEKTISIDDTTKTITWSWTEVPGATGYRVYRTSIPGAYGDTCLIAELSGSTSTSFVDDGSAPTTGTPPSVNTSGGVDAPNYGTPPDTFSTEAVVMGALASGQMGFLWILRVSPSVIDPRGNPRLAAIEGLE